jgi:excisionase family DNA binding protein
MQQAETVMAVGVAEAARRLGLSARTVATLIARRVLPSRKVGRRRIIPITALEAFIRCDHSTGCPAAAKQSDVNRRVRS